MAYDIRLDKDGGNIEMTYHCPTSLEECRQGRKKMLKACEEDHIHKILLDLSEVERTNGLSLTDCFFLADSWMEEKRPVRPVFGCVMPKEQEAKGNVSFYITAAKNRGISIEGFDDIESAKEWLAGR